MGVLEDDERLVVGVAVVALALLAGCGAIQGFVEDAKNDMGNVTVEQEGPSTVTVRVDNLSKANYVNVVVNGNTDEPRTGVSVVEAKNVTAQPRDASESDVEPSNSGEPMDGPPDVDADNASEVVRVEGLKPGDTVYVVAVDPVDTGAWQVVLERHTVEQSG